MRELTPSGKPVAVTSDGFSRQIISRHAGFGSSVRRFQPLISTRGIIPLLGRWIELIYAIPFLRVSREIITQRIEALAGKQNQLVRPVLNFLFNFGARQTIFQSLNRLPDRTLKELDKSLQSSYFYQTMTAFDSPAASLLPLSRAITLLHRERNEQRISRDRSQISPYAQSVSERTNQPVTERTKEISGEEDRRHLLSAIVPFLSTIHYHPLVLSHQMPSIINIAGESAVSPFARRITASVIAPLLKTGSERLETQKYAKATTDRAGSTGSRPAHSLIAALAPIEGAVSMRGTTASVSHLNVLNLTKIEPTYRTYPAMETIYSTENPQIIRETKVIEKETATKPPPPPKIDIERLTDEVYRLFERKVRIERERRGL